MASNAFSRLAPALGLAALALLASPAARAQSVATTPVGAMTYTFPATSQLTTTSISIPLTNPAVYTLPVASVTANTITFSGTPFSAGSLAQAGSPYFARIATGQQAGRTILVTANTTSSITVDTTDNSSQTTDLTTSGFAVAANDRVEIIVGDTIASLFGDNTGGNPLIFVGGTSTLNADTVGIYSKTLSRTVGYFFSTSLGYWRTSVNTVNQNNVVLYPESSIAIQQRPGRAATTITLTGNVPTIPPLVKVTGGVTSVSVGSGVPVDVTLGSLVLSNWTKGTSTLNSDVLGVYSPTTSRFEGYFQLSSNNEWRRQTTGATNHSGVTIPAGSAIVIQKRAAVSGAASYISFPLPYTL